MLNCAYSVANSFKWFGSSHLFLAVYLVRVICFRSSLPNWLPCHLQPAALTHQFSRTSLYNSKWFNRCNHFPQPCFSTPFEPLQITSNAERQNVFHRVAPWRIRIGGQRYFHESARLCRNSNWQFILIRIYAFDCNCYNSFIFPVDRLKRDFNFRESFRKKAIQFLTSTMYTLCTHFANCLYCFLHYP